MKILRKIIFYLSLLYFCISCNSANIEIDSSLVRVNEVSKKYTYKENGLPVNGRVIFYAKDLSGTQKIKISLREVREGVRIQTGYDYFPNGKIQRSYLYDKTVLISGVVKHYNEQGNLFVEAVFKNNKENGPTRIYGHL